MTSFVGRPKARETTQSRISTTTLTALIKQFLCVKAFYSEQGGITVEPSSWDENVDGTSQNAINEAELARIIRARRRRSDFLPSEFSASPRGTCCWISPVPR